MKRIGHPYCRPFFSVLVIKVSTTVGTLFRRYVPSPSPHFVSMPSRVLIGHVRSGGVTF